MGSSPRPDREWLRYDTVLKDLFQRDHPTLLNRLSGGVGVRQTLNVEFAIVDERRADLLFELEDQSLFLLDLQSTNDPDMSYRVGIYTLLAAQKYKRKVRAVVLYAGMARMRMLAHVDAGSAKVDYELMDIREISAETLIGRGPGDLALALLARGGPEQIRKILSKAMKLKRPDRDRVLIQLSVLAGLRRLKETIRMEIEKMGVYIDIQKTPVLRNAWDKGRAEGEAKATMAILSTQLKQKFGPLPRWALARLRRASAEQALEWSRRVLTAETLEAVVGSK